MRRVLSIAILALSVPGAAGADPSPAPAPSPAASASAKPVATLHIKDFDYAPRSLTVRPGDAVTFINDDDAAHTVTLSGKGFDSGNLEKGQSWTYRFETAGTYRYICTYHPTMKGTIVVSPPAP